MGEHGLNPVRFRFEFEEGGELRLPAGAAMVQHKPTSNSARRCQAEIHFDHSGHKIDAGGHAGRSSYRNVALQQPHYGNEMPRAGAVHAIRSVPEAESRIRAWNYGVLDVALDGCQKFPGLSVRNFDMSPGCQ
jgi:hypothetical protein